MTGIRRALVAATALVSLSCAKTDTRSAAETSTTPTVSPNVVTVTAMDFAFQAPEQIPAGLTMFQLLLRGENPHHLTIVKLDSGKKAADYVAALRPGAPPPAWATSVGGPNAGEPATTTNATLIMEPGDYALICFVDVPPPQPHFAKGMFRDLKVVARADTGAAATATSLPPADVTLNLVDGNFTTSRPLTAGLTTIRVENSGSLAHEVVLFRLPPGMTKDSVVAWLEKMQGPPRFTAEGGIAPMAPGLANNFTVNLKRGRYVLICFVPDAKDGKPHFMHGMVKEIEI